MKDAKQVEAIINSRIEMLMEDVEHNTRLLEKEAARTFEHLAELRDGELADYYNESLFISYAKDVESRREKIIESLDRVHALVELYKEIQ